MKLKWCSVFIVDRYVCDLVFSSQYMWCSMDGVP